MNQRSLKIRPGVHVDRTAETTQSVRPDIPSKPITMAGHLKEIRRLVIAQLIQTATGGHAIIR